jgi:hypothetical protein
MALIVSNNRILNSNSQTPIYQGGDMWTSGLEYAAGVITGYSGSAFNLGDSAVIVDSAYNKTTAWADGRFLTAHQDVSDLPYVKNASLNITANTITGISGLPLVDTSAQSRINTVVNNISYVSGVVDDVVASSKYSAGPNINITNRVISGKNWTNDINAASSYAYNQATARIPTGGWVESTALGIIDGTIRNISGIAIYDSSAHSRITTNTNKINYLSGEIDDINSGWDVVNNQITGYNGTAFKSYDSPIYSAGTNINITNNVISGKSWATEINAATSGKADKTAIPTVTDYTAGPNINIINHVISGKNWTTEINAATTGKADKTAIPVIVDYTAGANVNITNHIVSSKNWTPDINAATSGKADKTAIPTIVEYTAGANINITNHVVSGKNWQNTITAASSYAYKQATGTSRPSTPVVGVSGIRITKPGTNVEIGLSAQYLQAIQWVMNNSGRL